MAATFIHNVRSKVAADYFVARKRTFCWVYVLSDPGSKLKTLILA